MTTTVRVALGARGYDIHVGHGLIADAARHIVPLLPTKRTIIISDANVAPLYEARLSHALHAAGMAVESITIAAGEGSKSFAGFEGLMERLLALRPDRKTTLIALGGGVVGDLVGFAASVLLRGVPFIQIPTSLLAQVDSSVGGKTAINSAAGKNLIGSFYQPKLVLADSDTLTTLPLRELQAGYAEIIKYGLIADADFYHWCLAHGEALINGDGAARQHAVMTACRMKAEIVASDEHEGGARALLNFGHTFAHALEAETGYGQTLLHGEAVAIGMVMACRLSHRMGLLDSEAETQLAAHLQAIGLPAHLRDVAHTWDSARISRHFAGDKKAENGALTFVVLGALGRAQVAKGVDAALAHAVVETFVKE